MAKTRSAGHAPDRLNLLIGLLDDASANVQVAALKGLEGLTSQHAGSLSDESLSNGSLGDEPLQPLLDSSDSRLRCAALRLLSQQSDLSSRLDQRLTDRLLQGLQSQQPDEQVLCCELIAKTGLMTARQPLLQLAAETDAPVPVRRQALQALGQQHRYDNDTLTALWQCSQDSNPALRHVSLQVLQRLHNNAIAADEAAIGEPAAEENRTLETPQPSPVTPLSLLLSALNDTPVEWPAAASTKPNDDEGLAADDAATESKNDNEHDAVAQITLINLDDDGNPAKQLTGAVATPPAIEQILAAMPDAYPLPLDEAAQPQNMDSTLASITRGYIEATVGVSQQLSSDSERILGLVDDLPEAYSDFAEVVHSNARNGERMILEKCHQPEEIAADRRILAARVLGDCSPSEALQPLVGCLMAENANLRREAVDSLGRLASQQPTLPGLANILGPIATQLRAGNEEIRLACARTLGMLGAKTAIPALLAALDDPDTLVRIQAIRSLTTISLGNGKPLTADDHVLLSEVTPNRVTQAILNCHRDAEIGVRKAVIEALLALRHAELDLLIKLGLEEGGALTATAAVALKALSPEAATQKLIEALDQIDASTIRRLAMQMLQQIHATAAA